MHLRKMGLGLAAVIIIVGTGLHWLFQTALVTDTKGVYTVNIERGMSFNAVMKKFIDQGVIEGDFRPRFVGALLGLSSQLKAGRYELQSGESTYSFLTKLTSGRVLNQRITIPEGLQAREIAQIFQTKLQVDSSAFMAVVSSKAEVVGYGLQGETLEGYLFPNTYKMPWGVSPRRVVEILVSEFKKQVNDSLLKEIAKSEMNLLQVVTLASIIEGEAMVDSERPIISGVYQNRLRKGIRLQADPTIQYIIPDGPRRLLFRDLEIDSRYNTYRYAGLPPGPINNPGLNSILATLNPASVKYIYFVANGDGTHTFSRTLREHNRAKAKFDRVRRQIKGRGKVGK